MLATKSAGRVVLVNLTKTVLVDLCYLTLWMGAKDVETSVNLVVNEKGLEQALENPDPQRADVPRQIVAIQAFDHQLLQHCPLDVVVNIASMQEMDPPVVAGYFEYLRVVARKRDLLFYCCNRLEKKLPDGTVTKFAYWPC